MTTALLATQWTLEKLQQENLLLFHAVVGSQAYGLATPESDVDEMFVYCLPQEFLYAGVDVPHVNNPSNDRVGYELHKFMDLLQKGNPTILQLLFAPEDTIRYVHPAFELIRARRQEFITKQLRHSFAGYAHEQISKARGLQKKSNWKNDDVKRKHIVDFCQVPVNGGSQGSMPLTKWLRDSGFDSTNLVAVPLPRMRDMYAIFYEPNGRGLYVEESNSLRLGSVPKGSQALTLVSFNQDGYSTHCKRYQEYEHWLQTHNPTRYVKAEDGQVLDSKNVMHTLRLVRMAEEVAQGKGLIIRRTHDREELLAVRRGERNLRSIISESETRLENLGQLFFESDLPASTDRAACRELLLQVRQRFYQLQG